MRLSIFLLLVGALATGISACQAKAPACPAAPESERFLREEELAHALLATPVPYSAPVIVQLGGRQLVADRVVSGPLCNDNWRGTVYVGCDVRVPAWSDNPVFLKYCQLQVEPGTVVYVAAHNNSAYYQGCSCHTGEATPP
ncbi:MAG: hypothetical protein V1755_10020 [Chloroflexota bacterium]